MTVEQFLKAGHKFVDGDIVINQAGCVDSVILDFSWNKISETDDSMFILRAAALEKPKRLKVEYVKVEFASDKEKAEAFIEGGLRYFTHGETKGEMERDTILVTRLDELLCGNAIYRRVETEISERDEFIEEALKRCVWKEGSPAHYMIGDMYDAGCRFNPVEGE